MTLPSFRRMFVALVAAALASVAAAEFVPDMNENQIETEIENYLAAGVSLPLIAQMALTAGLDAATVTRRMVSVTGTGNASAAVAAMVGAGAPAQVVVSSALTSGASVQNVASGAIIAGATLGTVIQGAATAGFTLDAGAVTGMVMSVIGNAKNAVTAMINAGAPVQVVISAAINAGAAVPDVVGGAVNARVPVQELVNAAILAGAVLHDVMADAIRAGAPAEDVIRAAIIAGASTEVATLGANLAGVDPIITLNTITAAITTASTQLASQPPGIVIAGTPGTNAVAGGGRPCSVASCN